MTRTDHWKLGLFVSMGLVLGIASIFWVGANRFRRDAIPAVTYFDESVQGLEIGSPVKFRGVQLGTVSDVTVAPDHRHVQVSMEIFTHELERLGLEAAETMDPEVRVQLASAGITGVKFLQVDFFDPTRYPMMPLPFEPGGNYISSVPSTLKGLEAALYEFLDKLPSYGEKIKRVLEEARDALAQLKAVAAAMQDEQGPVQTLVKRVDSAITTLEGAVREAKVGETTASLRSTAGAVSTASGSISKAAGSVSDAAGAMTQVAGNVSSATDQLEAAILGLRETLESVRALASDLDRDPSAILRGKRPDPMPQGGQRP